MKRELLLLIFIVFSFFTVTSSNAQWVTIPDANFVTYLQTNFATCMNGNQMDTTCVAITSATKVNCMNKNINDLSGIEYFDNLDTLLCGINNLTSLINIPPTVTHLNCYNNDLTDLPTIPPDAIWVDCKSNSLTNLGTLPSTLQFLDCSFNQLVSLPALPPNLYDLRATDNALNNLPSLPLTISSVFVGSNQLTVLPALPATLLKLQCSENLLSSLPPLPSGLNFLQASDNPFISFPALPAQIDTVHVLNTGFTALPSPLPLTLTSLSFGNPGFTVTPTLPNGLIQLVIYGSDLAVLPTFPASLETIDLRLNHAATSVPPLPPGLKLFASIDNDGLQTLPSIPSSVRRFYATLGSFTSIPELPDTLDICYLDNNQFLTCLPQIKEFGTFSFQNTPVTCIPNYGQVTTSYPPLSSFPLCDIFNTNSCDFYFNIAGKVYADNNSNCIPEPTETMVSPVKINLFQAGNLVQQTYTTSGGVYNFDASIGNYTYSVDTTNVPFQVICPPSGELQSVLTLADSVDLNMDFGLECKLQNDLGTHAIVQDSGVFRPANVALVNVIAGDMAQVYNLNCASGVSGTVTVYYSGPATYSGNAVGSLIPVATPNTLTYSIADFGLIDIHEAFQFYLTTDTLAQAGDQICITVNVTLIAGDLNPSNNILTHCFSVINSFDPNIKEVSPVDFIANTGEWLTYTIHFQNTGNAPAQHIVITDTLDAKLQEATFMYLGSSHDPVVEATGNVLKFNFPNINLPDSTNDEPNSHGYVQYKVKIDQGLSLGQIIENNAAIYFDFNAPVITNTTSTLIVAPTALSEIQDDFFTVYPNPSSEKMTVRSTSSGLHNLILTDVAGRIVYKKEFTGSELNFNVNEFASGMYFLNLESGGKSEVLKVVVRK